MDGVQGNLVTHAQGKKVASLGEIPSPILALIEARNPEFLKDIVYRMRFDEASARYAEFGPFYTGYISTAEEMLAHCRLTGRDRRYRPLTVLQLSD